MDNTNAQKFIDRFGGSIYYAMPDFGLVYHYRGRDYLLEDITAEVEAVMVNSLEQEKNLIPKAFPLIDFGACPDRVY